MSATLAILTVGVVPVSAVLPLLTEHISEDQITHISLLGKITREEVMEDYSPDPGDEVMLTLLNDNRAAEVSRNKVEKALQGLVEVLDNQGYDVILLMSTYRFNYLKARNSMLLEPERIIPPLVASIVDGHQVGVVIPVPELLNVQAQKWQTLEKAPFYALANPVFGTDEELVNAGRELIGRGADVLVLDCLGFYQKHRDLLQKALDVPVLLSNVLVARLAAELLV
ncbi:AroM family protein [Franconibacter pulveris]|uniref:AroM family protein n=1 Tax=Franconibacter pulveris TaxID=435910 RepID=UPI0004983C90|nr:AroM family protein [Franconibacter pulveris]HBI09518.1 AroM protein [Franconibacter pulveris]